jgi:SAM-dependent methyltransferase
MPWWFHAIAEKDHDIQDPMSPEKIRRLGDHLRLNSESRVLDVACGHGGPALVLAETFGCHIVGVERAAEFVDAARERIAAAKLGSLIEIMAGDALDYSVETGTFDVIMCLGATFIWGGLDGTLDALTPAAKPGGYLVVGEPYWRQWPPATDDHDVGWTTLPEITHKFEAAGLRVTGVIGSSQDDWDAYESLHWRALEEWLEQHGHDPQWDEIHREHRAARDRYLTIRRELLGWAIISGRKPAGPPGDVPTV